jgi:hypothetical protein
MLSRKYFEDKTPVYEKDIYVRKQKKREGNIPGWAM